MDYAALADKALALITRFGTAGQLVVRTNSGTAFDPTVSSAAHACRAVLVDYENREVDGTSIMAGDRKALLAASGLAVEPSVAHGLVLGGQTYEVVSVASVRPADVTVLYELQVRR